jgi:hypothetical protein
MTENNSCSGGSEKPAVVFGRNDSTRVVCSRVSLSRGNARAALQTAALCANGYRFPKRQGKPAFHEFGKCLFGTGFCDSGNRGGVCRSDSIHPDI